MPILQPGQGEQHGRSSIMATITARSENTDRRAVNKPPGSDYNANLARASRPQRQLRIRVVVHAGEVHYDANGCFGEALDIAFRLLDAAHVKKALQAAADPLILVISGDIYRAIVCHGYDGIDQRAFYALVRVRIAGHRYPGWIHIPSQAARDQVTEIASYRQPA
jgi:class 3 adenylate cyclase